MILPEFKLIPDTLSQFDNRPLDSFGSHVIFEGLDSLFGCELGGLPPVPFVMARSTQSNTVANDRSQIRVIFVRFQMVYMGAFRLNTTVSTSITISFQASIAPDTYTFPNKDCVRAISTVYIRWGCCKKRFVTILADYFIADSLTYFSSLPCRLHSKIGLVSAPVVTVHLSRRFFNKFQVAPAAWYTIANTCPFSFLPKSFHFSFAIIAVFALPAISYKRVAAKAAIYRVAYTVIFRIGTINMFFLVLSSLFSAYLIIAIYLIAMLFSNCRLTPFTGHGFAYSYLCHSCLFSVFQRAFFFNCRPTFIAIFRERRTRSILSFTSIAMFLGKLFLPCHNPPKQNARFDSAQGYQTGSKRAFQD